MLLLFSVKRERERKKERKDRHLGGGCGLPEAKLEYEGEIAPGF